MSCPHGYQRSRVLHQLNKSTSSLRRIGPHQNQNTQLVCTFDIGLVATKNQAYLTHVSDHQPILILFWIWQFVHNKLSVAKLECFAPKIQARISKNVLCTMPQWCLSFRSFGASLCLAREQSVCFLCVFLSILWFQIDTIKNSFCHQAVKASLPNLAPPKEFFKVVSNAHTHLGLGVCVYQSIRQG